MPVPADEGGFLAFSDLLTGYRQAEALMLAHEAGVFAAVGGEGGTGAELCARIGWEPFYGDRFLRCLCSLGLLRQQEERYTLSRFSQTYLSPASAHYQGRTLLFERQLHQSWQQLAATLAAGQRVFAAGEKSPEERQQAFATYLGAMDEAARIRAEELWEVLPMAAAAGTILDLGAGSGAFLASFLGRYPGWRGIFCDLPEVVTTGALHQRLTEMADRLTWCACNLLAIEPSEFDAIGERSCDLVLLSNIVHCQGTAETELLLSRAAAKATDSGLLVVHDFFSDTGWRGALYDLHMMLNTYNGQTYTQEEVVAMAASQGFTGHTRLRLPSGTTALTFVRHKD